MKYLIYIILSSLIFSCSNMPHQVAQRQRESLGIKDGDNLGINNVIESKRHEIAKCRKQSIRQNRKKPRGEVQLVWLVQSSGRSSDVKIVSDTLKDKSVMAECLVKFVQKTKFIPTSLSRMSKVTYRFNF